MENSDELIEKMKLLNIKPKPVWHFTFKTAFYWFLFLVSVILGAFAFSIILFSIQQTDFDLVSHMSHSKLEFLLGMAPFFWIISLFIFLFVAMIGIKKSKKGYKFSYAKLVAFSASFSILVGTSFFIGGGGEWLENTFSARVGLYEGIESKKAKFWSEPENGFIAGNIVEVGNNTIQLADLSNKIWTIDIEHANIPRSVLITEGEKIKIMGEIISENSFRASEIRPWGGGNGGQKGQKRKGQNK
jgi:RNase P/RNase MRP subunit p29